MIHELLAPDALPATSDALRVVQDFTQRNVAYPQLSEAPHFRSFWRAVNDEASNLTYGGRLWSLRFLEFVFTSDFSASIRSDCSWLSLLLSGRNGVEIVAGNRFVTGPSFLASRLYDHRTTLAWCATQSPTEFTLQCREISSSADSLFGSIVAPIILVANQSEYPEITDLGAVYSDGLDLSMMVDVLSSSACFSNALPPGSLEAQEFLCEPWKAAALIQTRRRAELIVRALNGDIPQSWWWPEGSSFTEGSLLLAISKEEEDSITIEVPFHPYWEPVPDVHESVAALLSDIRSQASNR